MSEFLYGRQIHQVEYLESTGTQYIDTGIIGKTGVKAFIDFEWLNGNIGNDRYVIAASTGTTRTYFGTYQSKWMFGNGSYIQAKGIQENVRYNAEISWLLDNSYVDINGNRIITSTTTGEVNTNLTLWLFSRNQGYFQAGWSSVIKMYSCKIYEVNTLVRDYKPAVDENGVGFMFDRVSHTIFDNAGTGLFKYPAVELEYLESNGGPCIDTGIKPTDEYGYRIRNTYRYDGGEQCAIGAMDAGNRFVGVYTGGTQISGGWGSFVNWLKTSHEFNDDTIWDVYCNYKNDRQIIVNDELLKDLTDIHIDGTITNTIYLFGRHYGNNVTKMYGRIYSTEITKGSDVVAHFIPVLKDGQLGMWDKVNEVFYPNNGTGTFIGGKIVESEEE